MRIITVALLLVVVPTLGHPAAPVLVIVALGLSGARRDRHARFADQLTRRLVHAHHRIRRVVRPPIDLDHPFHRRHEVPVALRGNHPPDALPRFEFVFFRTRRTVSCDTLSMYPSSTTRSANSRSDHCAWPSGGSPQLNAIRRASNAPSALRRYVGRRPCRPPSAASNPTSTKRFFTQGPPGAG